ncbi:hypothetical protein [Algoriphagus formosus]|uniref:Uncharacterized protein n=1 Tax=Algoriphagus formosus TaxID=2007308 RepID=A0A4V3ASP7_9BACT|nr:hypothetical protein [Algoriphagus aquimaris]MCR9080894.1 hypothetical protein [Cyclobacteriaceae bacterium]TDK51471.1 hypothetical protein E1898_00030 [Algoriphagus aquimaris]
MSQKSVIKIPVRSFVKKYFFSKFSSLIIEERYLDLRGSRVPHLVGVLRLLVEKNVEKYTPNTNKEKEDILEVILPVTFSVYGISEEKVLALSRCLSKLVRSEISIFVANLSSLPLMSRTEAIRIAMDFYNISIDDYDPEHYRRSYDRYFKNNVGCRFEEYQRKLTKFLLNFYYQKALECKESPELIQKRIIELKKS